MRRITLWMISTIAVLVLLFSYRTSTSGAGNGSTGANNGAGIVSSPGTATT